MLTPDRALRLPGVPAVAFTGAGGKTTALFDLAHTLRPSVVTATTHLGDWQTDRATLHLVIEPGGTFSPGEAAPGCDILLVTGTLDPASHRYIGLPIDDVDRLARIASQQGRSFLVEADGARRRPLKAPAEHEPPIPGCAGLVVVVAGLSAVGRPLAPATVHRPEIFAALAGRRVGELIDPASIAAVLVHPAGGLKNIPPAARRVVLLNQADTASLRDAGRAMAPALLSAFDAVAVASLRPQATSVAPGLDDFTPRVHSVHERVAAVVLAAGGASRFGEPKQLLDYRGRPFVRAVAETAIAAGLSPAIVVTGASGDRVRRALDGTGAQCVPNHDWRLGQGTSVRTGVAALPPRVGAAVFLLADQPHVPVAVLHALVARHAETLAPVVAPFVGSARATPTLFDRLTFASLMSLTGDQGGREILSQYAVERVVWDDRRLLLDVDTPDDFARLTDEA